MALFRKLSFAKVSSFALPTLIAEFNLQSCYYIAITIMPFKSKNKLNLCTISCSLLQLPFKMPSPAQLPSHYRACACLWCHLLSFDKEKFLKKQIWSGAKVQVQSSTWQNFKCNRIWCCFMKYICFVLFFYFLLCELKIILCSPKGLCACCVWEMNEKRFGNTKVKCVQQNSIGKQVEQIEWELKTNCTVHTKCCKKIIWQKCQAYTYSHGFTIQNVCLGFVYVCMCKYSYASHIGYAFDPLLNWMPVSSVDVYRYFFCFVGANIA